jgi:hypothetical protein
LIEFAARFSPGGTWRPCRDGGIDDRVEKGSDGGLVPLAVLGPIILNCLTSGGYVLEVGRPRHSVVVVEEDVCVEGDGDEVHEHLADDPHSRPQVPGLRRRRAFVEVGAKIRLGQKDSAQALHLPGHILIQEGFVGLREYRCLLGHMSGLPGLQPGLLGHVCRLFRLGGNLFADGVQTSDRRVTLIS